MQSHNPFPQAPPPTSTLQTRGDKMVAVMVGLPARGKSYISRRICNFMHFFYNVPCKTFNVGNYRRNLANSAFQTADFFDPSNKEALALRNKASELAMRDLIEWMNQVAPTPQEPNSNKFVSGDFGALGVFDATNSTVERRHWIREQLKPLGVKVIFIESICNDEALIEQNILASKVGGKDYFGVDDAQAVNDFRARIYQYQRTYEQLSNEFEPGVAWIKVVDAGRNVSVNNVRGFLPSRIAQFLMNINTTRRSIYFTRHGQSEYNVAGKIGGDSGLSEHGEEYAHKLAEWASKDLVKDGRGNPTLVRLWTSSLKRAVDTVKYIPHPPVHINGVEWVQMRPKVFRNLDEIFAGVCDGLSNAEIAIKFPNEAAAREGNKFTYRYPRGESYQDLIARLEPLVHEIERQREPILIVSHQAVLRCLFAYFMGIPREDCVNVSIPLNTVIKVRPTSGECTAERFCLLQTPPDVEDEPSSH